MTHLSVVIITLNEEKNIARCLQSVKDIADEVVVIDSFSSDKTGEICKDAGARFIQQSWEGYSATKNTGNSLASHDWILSLDADEELSEELRQSILREKNKGFRYPCSFNRLTNYCGKWVRHSGWYPDTKVRIFNRTTTKWEGTIHEELILTGDKKIIHLQGDCFHYSYYTISDHLKQMDKFTEIAARDLYERGKKVSILKTLFSSWFKFIRDYFFRMGFRDGFTGFIICSVSAFATFTKYIKLRKLWEGK